MIRLYLKEPFPDDCGTDQNKVLCCVPTLKRCSIKALHRSRKGKRDFSKKSLKLG